MRKTLVEEVAVSISMCGSKHPWVFDERHWLDVTQFAQFSARDLAPVVLGALQALPSLWCDWSAHTAMASKASFRPRVSLTQATAVDARRQNASTYIFASPDFKSVWVVANTSYTTSHRLPLLKKHWLSCLVA